MTVYKKESTGKWYCRYRVFDIAQGKFIQKKKFGFNTKREALEYERKELENNSVVDSSIKVVKTMTFLDIANEWESHLDSSADTKKQHQEHWNIRCDMFKDKPIVTITKPMMMQWRQWLSAQDYSTSTKNKTITFVKGVFKYATDIYSIPNPSTQVKRFKKTDEELLTEMNVWTIDEFNQFIQHVNNELYRKFFTTLFWTGMRLGECIALYTDDFEDGYLTVKYSQENTSDGRKPTKTKTMRKIKVDDHLNVILSELKSHYGKHTYLFGGNTPVTPSSATRVFKKAISDSGVKKIRIHDLRHSHATILINNGVNIVAVSKRLGHSTIEQTLKTYTHLLKDTDLELISTLNSLSK